MFRLDEIFRFVLSRSERSVKRIDALLSGGEFYIPPGTLSDAFLDFTVTHNVIETRFLKPYNDIMSQTTMSSIYIFCTRYCRESRRKMVRRYYLYSDIEFRSVPKLNFFPCVFI